MIRGFKPSVEWLLEELWADDPWIYAPDGDRCFWCARPRDAQRLCSDYLRHADNCPWRLVWEHKNLGPLEKNA